MAKFSITSVLSSKRSPTLPYPFFSLLGVSGSGVSTDSLLSRPHALSLSASRPLGLSSAYPGATLSERVKDRAGPDQFFRICRRWIIQRAGTFLLRGICLTRRDSGLEKLQSVPAAKTLSDKLSSGHKAPRIQTEISSDWLRIPKFYALLTRVSIPLQSLFYTQKTHKEVVCLN